MFLLIPTKSEQPFRALLIKTINEISLWQQTTWLADKRIGGVGIKNKSLPFVISNKKFNSLKFPQKFNQTLKINTSQFLTFSKKKNRQDSWGLLDYEILKTIRASLTLEIHNCFTSRDVNWYQIAVSLRSKGGGGEVIKAPDFTRIQSIQPTCFSSIS